MIPITLGAYTVATTSAGALHVRTGDYLLIVTPDRRTEPWVETTFLPPSRECSALRPEVRSSHAIQIPSRR